MTCWDVRHAEMGVVLRTADQTMAEYPGHGQRLDAALFELMAALPHSLLVRASLSELAHVLIRPQLDDIVTGSTAALGGASGALAAYREADARMGQDSLLAGQHLPPTSPSLRRASGR